MNRTFDRLQEFDKRSKLFPIRGMFKTQKRRSYTWSCGIWLDQGSEGACVGFSVSQEAAARPHVVKGITNQSAIDLYRRARQLDEFPGEDYSGSSVLGGMKAAVEKGWYTEYRWAFGEEDLAISVGYHGPAVLGINWYESMGNPDKNGLITVSGKKVGGHAILCNGYNVKNQLYRLHNSWGKSWGVNGDCFVTVADMQRLLAERGEACIPVIRKG